MSGLKILALVGATAMALVSILNLFQCEASQYSTEWLYAACSTQFWLGVAFVCLSLGGNSPQPGRRSSGG